MTTMDKLRIDDGYVLERTDAEAERLKAQAQLMGSVPAEGEMTP